MADLLVFAVTPDQTVLRMAQVAVAEEGHHLQTFQSSAELLDALERGDAPHLVLLEPETNREKLHHKLLGYVSESNLCFMVKPGERNDGSTARAFPAARYLTKPILRRDIDKLLEEMAHSMHVHKVFGLGNAAQPVNPATNALRNGRGPQQLIIDDLGDNRYFLALSPAMLEIYRQVKLLEGIGVSVLILGESGTGKEVIAHLLHKHSHRAQNKFVNVNCAALPMDLLESELFGHVKGAFTGAIGDRPGRFEQSSGGTILLDEIGEISASMQAKLLHVLQDGQFTRLGGRQPTKADLHVLAATNIAMERALANRTFREDLYYRLNTFTINVPPLRERREEIPYLVSEMIWRTPAEMKPCGFERFSAALMYLLPLYHWPGNLRELRNFITRTMIMQDESAGIRELEMKIDMRKSVKSEPSNVLPIRDTHPMRALVQDVKHRTETHMIEEALLASGWNRRTAARSLNISYRSLLYKIQQYQLSPYSKRLTG